jgi:hypothetical protein
VRCCIHFEEKSMNRQFARVLHGIAVLAFGVSSAIAAPVCKPVVGSFQAAAVPPGQGHCPAAAPLCTAGRVWGGIQGSYQFVMTAASPAAPLGGPATVVFFTGTSAVALNSGASISGTDTGSLDLPPGLGGFASLITFVGGGGGQIRLRGEFNATDGSTTGDYLGTLCTT